MKLLITAARRLPAVVLLLALPLAVHAEAGKVLFIYGAAQVQSTDGSRSALRQGASVENGDRIVTSANGRVQLRMSDGGLLALRPQTEFVIEDYSYPQADGIEAATGQQARSFFTLVKGGFRSITGTIGKNDKSAYRVRTPVATIGIRGTDYTAMYCASGCDAVKAPQGLYVGVSEGGVRLSNKGGSLDLDAGQFGYAADAATAPVRSSVAESVVAARTSGSSQKAADEGDSAQAEVAANAEDDAGNAVNLSQGAGESDNTGAVAFADGTSGVSAAGSAALARDADGNVTGFSAGDDSFGLDGRQVVNSGQDTDRAGATGLSWGRWASSDSDADSLHYIAGPDGTPAPVLPTEGVANFELVGNTNPTDSDGNVGTLGSADLQADFTSQTVDADVNLSFDQTSEVWEASARDVDINGSDATFGGEFDTVTVTSESGVDQGEGDLSGFFSGNEDGELSGAGMSYSLSDTDDTSVSGTAAFQVDTSND